MKMDREMNERVEHHFHKSKCLMNIGTNTMMKCRVLMAQYETVVQHKLQCISTGSRD